MRSRNFSKLRQEDSDPVHVSVKKSVVKRSRKLSAFQPFRLLLICVLLPVFFWHLLLLFAAMWSPQPQNSYPTVSLSALSTINRQHLRQKNQLVDTLSTSQLVPFRNVFVTANFYNSENILKNLLPEISRFAATLHASKRHRVFVALQENGSRDRTAKMLHAFGDELSNAYLIPLAVA